MTIKPEHISTRSDLVNDLMHLCHHLTKGILNNITPCYSHEGGFVLPNNDKYPFSLTSPQMGRQLRCQPNDLNCEYSHLRFKDDIECWDNDELRLLKEAIEEQHQPPNRERGYTSLYFARSGNFPQYLV